MGREYGNMGIGQCSMASLFRGAYIPIAITVILLHKFVFILYNNCKNMMNQPLKYLRLNHTIVHYSVL